MTTMTKTAAQIGTKVYYTGDMANNSGWFTIISMRQNGSFNLLEDDEDRREFLGVPAIGDVYQGHCNPRFVTEEAYRRFHS